jgi:hypothetical protein
MATFSAAGSSENVSDPWGVLSKSCPLTTRQAQSPLPRLEV